MNLTKYFPVYKKNLQLAFPVILSQAGQVSVNLADNMMVGHAGTTELAAASFALNIFLFGMLFGMGITIGLTPLVGHSYGSKKIEKVGEWFKNGLLAHSIVAVLLVIIMSLITPLMHGMGQSPDVVKMAIPYYLILVASLFPMLIFFSFKQFLEGLGNTRTAMIITLSANVINIALNYLLIFGKFGFPALGLLGAGIATLIARLSMPLIFFIIIRRNQTYSYFFKLAYQAQIKLKKIKKILSVGLPIGSQMIIEMAAFSVGAIMMGWLSKESLAAHQVAIGMASFTFMLSVGLASGTTIRTSHLAGENNPKEMKLAITASLHLVVLFMSLMGLSFILFRHYIPFLFTTDEAVIGIAARLLIIAALFQIFDGLQVVLIGALRGMADVKRPMIMAFFSYIVVGLPVSYLAAFIFNWGEIGIWTGFLFGLATAAVLFGTRMATNFKQMAN